MFRANPTSLESIREEAALDLEKAWDSWIQNEKHNRYNLTCYLSLTYDPSNNHQTGYRALHPRR